eukprot:TRINITY_DN5786_c0_g1_i2.p1 TRINITY_DN5786_c0_g1~~TRINITY_DN5786_c0_g1_i2.p1  ORF type:complete len:158 (+),score=31.14 TRINITY_DN5786_c0_g1_i2:191-664(+)
MLGSSESVGLVCYWVKLFNDRSDRRPAASDSSFAAPLYVHAGWIVKDEDDHQPFNVKTMTRQPFWYRPTEVHYLCSPGDRVMMANAHKGLPVVRGQDWKWGDQDDKSYGHVAVSGLDRGDGWVEVKWTVSKETKCYRVGVENAYDLRVADMAQFDSG